MAKEKTRKVAQEEVADTYDSRIVEVRRTAKVRDGGRDFSFSAIVVVGDGKGQVGFGRGKAKEVIIAVQKANDKARRNVSRISLRGDTLQHPILSQSGATTVLMKPASQGTGVIAGGALRSVFEVLGVKNVVAKIIGSANPNNVIKAAIQGLKDMVSPDVIARRRGKTVNEILGRKENENG